jgi:4-hydroxybutyryl-CoA dehydratase/vinylacetyl-CoA-Delta-isomerase
MLTEITFASAMTLLTAGDRIAKVRPQGRENIRKFVQELQLNDWRMTECITDAKGDRSKPPAKQDDADAYLRVIERRPDGVVVRGAKLHISLSPLSHELMTIPTKAMKPDEKDYAIAFSIPVNTKGVKIVNVGKPPAFADPRDFPVSSKNFISQGFVIYDDVFVPNERVFIDGETELAAVFAHSLGLWTRAMSLARMADEADMLAGLAQLIADANGLEKVSQVKEKIADMVIHATLIRATLEASFANTRMSPEGVPAPSELFTNAGKYIAAANYSTMIRHLMDIAGGSGLTVPSMLDLENPETGALVRKYMATKSTVDGEYRMRLLHVIRDVTASSTAGYRASANLLSGGGLYAQRIVTRGRYDMERAKGLALDVAGLPRPAAADKPVK